MVKDWTGMEEWGIELEQTSIDIERCRGRRGRKPNNFCLCCLRRSVLRLRAMSIGRADRRLGWTLLMPAQAWGTPIIGVVGFAGVIAGFAQRAYADRRAEWWRRATWAVDHTLEDDIDEQVLGFDVLAKLQKSKLATATDRELFADRGNPQVSADEGDTGEVGTDTGNEEGR
jgi:hypothetical protein